MSTVPSYLDILLYLILFCFSVFGLVTIIKFYNIIKGTITILWLIPPAVWIAHLLIFSTYFIIDYQDRVTEPLLYYNWGMVQKLHGVITWVLMMWSFYKYFKFEIKGKIKNGPKSS